jgi:glucose-6-phosphate isomerase
MTHFKQNFKQQLTKKENKIIDDAFTTLKEEKESGKIGYYKLYETSQDILKEVKKYKKDNKYLKNKKIKNIVVVGIGGSTLGTKAVYELIKLKQKSSINIVFLENVDPLDIASKTKDIKKTNSLFVVISKSGGTIETISIFKYILQKFKLDLKKDNSRLIAITDKDSNLSKLATKNNIPQFNIPLNVGGRFSVLSAVGVVPLTLAGYKVEKILKGSQDFIESFFDKKENHLLQKGYYYFKNKDKYCINTLFSYSTSFSYFNDWYVQLWAESLGKIDSSKNKVGLTPVGLVGSIDQHSFLQLIIQGTENKTVSFIQIEDFGKNVQIPKMNIDFLEKTDFVNGYNFDKLLNEECNATIETLIDENIPTDSIVLDKLSEKNIGLLLSYYEVLTSVVGAFLDINTYDQPGVEFGKKKLVSKFS